jgi:uncharacterized protein DUF3168
MSASWALQQAVFAELAANDAVKDAFGDPPRIFDVAPRGAAFPYCVIGDDAMSDWSTATETGSEHLLEIRAWSRAAGHKEAKLAASAVQDALDGASLSVDGETLIDIRHLATSFTRESDGETIRAVLKFRAVLEEN